MLAKIRMEWSGFGMQNRTRKLQRQLKESQAHKLFQIMQTQQSTVFGMQHALGRVYDPVSLRRRVSIQSDESMAPYIKAICRGKTNVLTAGTVTGLLRKNNDNKKSFIPVTKDFEKSFAAATALNLSQTTQRFPDIVNGAWAYVTRGKLKPNTVDLLHKNAYGEMFLREGRVISDKRYLLQLVENKNIRLITARSFDDLVFYSKAIETLQWQIIAALYNGSDVELEHERVAVARDRGRAMSLERCIARKGYLTLKDIWPMLQLVALPLDTEQYEHLMYIHLQLADHVPVKNLNCDPFNYFWSNSPSLYSPDSVLLPDSGFYEFLVDGEHVADDAKTVLMHELDAGARYRVVMTNAHGWFRYNTDVLVEVVAKQGDMPVVRFLNQTQTVDDSSYLALSNSTFLSTANSTQFAADFI